MKRLIRIFLLTTLTTLLVMGSFNWFVDPFAEFGAPEIPGFNLRKTEAFAYDRQSRHAMVLRLKPDCLLLGSSRVAVGFDAGYLVSRGCSHPYNGGLAGATMEEVEQLLELGSEQQAPRLVVLSLDLFMFNATRPPRDSDLADGGSVPIRKLKTLRRAFSISTLQASLRTIEHQSSLAPFEPDGDMQDVVFGATLEYMGNHRALFLRGLQGYIGHNLPPPHYRFAYKSASRDSLESLRRILARRYAAKGTQTVVMFSPAHAWQWQLLSAIGLGSQWDDFKRQTTAIVREEALRASAQEFPVFDFAVPSEVQSAAVPSITDTAARVHGYWDGSHFNKATGELALRAAFLDGEHISAARLGEKIDASTVESHLRQVAASLEKWRQANPETVDEIDALVGCYAPAPLAHRLLLVPPDPATCRRFRLMTR